MRQFLATLPGRFVIAFTAIFALLVVTGGYAYRQLARTNAASEAELLALKSSLETSQRVATSILREVAAGMQSLTTGDEADERRYHQLSDEAEALRRKAIMLDLLSAEERAQVEAIGTLQGRVEARLGLAHAYRQIGREPDARRVLQLTATEIRGIEEALEKLRAGAGARLERRRAEMRAALRTAEWKLLAAVVLGLLFLVWRSVQTSRMVTRPIAAIATSVRALGEGDLREDSHPPTVDESAAEFAELARALQRTRQRLKGLLEQVQVETDRVARAAGELADAAVGAAGSTGQVTTAMGEMATTANAQLGAFEQVNAAALKLAAEGHAIGQAASASETAGTEIRGTANATRAEISRAIAMLLGAREVVASSAAEIAQLRDATAHIERYVTVIADIASQTNLLALNAAIEAARAGEEGQGFAVVAEEIRTLADESARAASEVAESTRRVRERVASASGAAEAGSARMRDIESVAGGASDALALVERSVARVEEAAGRVAAAVRANATALMSVEQAIGSARDMAQGHAASAQEVAAATEQTSATVQQVSATADELRTASSRVRELVGGFKT